MFQSISWLATLLLLAPLAFSAPTRMDTLAIRQSEGGLRFGCTQDKLCVGIAPSQGDCEGRACAAAVADGTDLILKLSGKQFGPAQTSYRLMGLLSAEEEPSIQLWPQLIRFRGGILAGVETQVRAMYSGGGAGSTTLHLIAFLPGQPPFKVLSVPQSANVMIRACYSERDMKHRAGVCHDEYGFDASLALTGTTAAGMPVLRYRSKATSFPGSVSRSEDSLARRPLRKRDIVTVIDRRCSYQRMYRFAPKARHYAPDKPSPDCSDYILP